MSKIGIKTRGNSSPQGKSRVYFCCHPKDFELYFEEIANEILIRYNCVICYEEEPEHSFEKELLLADLSRMQLFVIPVTSNFLFEKNRGMEIELAFAKENHIPILPLLQSSDLADAFNRICGELQYLDKNIKDETGISYEKKLDRFLDAVLVADETAARVRAAFDAYIFLSYRKKDRQHANKLMQIIHKNVFCRDVAIWYDEYLSPGENFNDSIEDALKKSSLFLMAVTPNLVNEENYVSAKEYPLANELRKPILSIEMMETDEEKMKEKFEGCSELISCEDEEAITNALRKKVRDIDLWSNAHFPEHDYLIGMAYLNGIDVEIDTQKAIALIEGAANRGWVEAIDQMIHIYRNGIGTERDTEKMIYWQKEKIKLTEAKLQKEEMDADTFLSSIKSLAIDFTYNGDDEKAIEQYELLLKRAKKVSWLQFSLFDRFVWYADAYIGMGEVYNFMNNFSFARRYLKKGIFLRRILALINYHVDASLELSTAYQIMGNTYSNEGNYTEAEKYFDKSMMIREVLHEEEDSPNSSYNLELTYARLGNCFKDAGKLDQARLYFEKAISLGSSLHSEEQSTESAKKLYWRFDDIGDVCFDQQDYETAADYYRKSLELKETYADSSCIYTKRELARSCMNLAGKIGPKDRALAFPLFQEASRHFQAVYEATHYDDDLLNLTASLYYYGYECNKKGDRQYLEKALTMIEKLIAKEYELQFTVPLKEKILAALKP